MICFSFSTHNAYSFGLLNKIMCTYVFILGLMSIMHVIYTFTCSVHLSMFYMEKCYRKKIIFTVIFASLFLKSPKCGLDLQGLNQATEKMNNMISLDNCFWF